MKYIYPVIIALLLISCQKEDKAIDMTKTDWAFYNLKGNVKSVSDNSFTVLNERLEKGPAGRDGIAARDIVLEFNDEGMLVSEKQLGSDGKVLEETKFMGREKVLEKTQNITGNMAVKTLYTWDQSGKDNTMITKNNFDNSLLYKFETKYKNHLPVEKITYDSQNIVTERFTYSYDDKGNVTDELLYGRDGMLLYKNVFGYDKAGKNKVSEKRYDRDSKLINETLYNYSGGKLSKEETFNGKGETEYSKKFLFDAKGNVTKESVFENFDNATTTDDHTYDTAGNRVKTVTTKNNKVVLTGEYKYDDKKGLTESKITDEQGRTIENKSFKHEYDEAGNVVKTITYKDGKPVYINERKITYHN